MTHISGFARDQLLLLPEPIDDHVDVDNPVRFIDALLYLPSLLFAHVGQAASRAQARAAILAPRYLSSPL
jgi:hypothetical protein